MVEGDIIICVKKIQHATIGKRYIAMQVYDPTWTNDGSSVVLIKSDDNNTVTLGCDFFLTLTEDRNKKLKEFS